MMPKKTTDKLVVTNGAAMKAKYGTEYKAINKAIDLLITADKARGITTVLVEIDAAATMKKLRAKPVSKPLDQKQCKTAIDDLYKAMSPAYIMILGAPDIIPHQHLTNPITGDDEEDPDVPSDLPYACDAPYSKKASKFLGPTRVVSRLPDINRGSESAYLIDLVKTAIKWKLSPRSQYENCFSLTAKVWHASTALSAEKLFGSSAKVKDCPPGGPNWTAAQLKPKSHFINCHGDTPASEFFGQKDEEDDTFPVAMGAANIRGKVAAGTVVASECCYGAELYDPQLTGGQPGICHAYLGDGGFGFLGSTTIAYGPADGNGSADLICQYYLKYILEGASSGRAALQARQDFVSNVGHLDPVDLKTLAQFFLLGDPSIQPVAIKPPKLPMAKTTLLRRVTASLPELPESRNVRRVKLEARGLALQSSARCAGKNDQIAPSAETRKVLLGLAKQAKMKVRAVVGYELEGGRQAKTMSARAEDIRYFIVASPPKEQPKRRTRAANEDTGVPAKRSLQKIVFVAKEMNGKLVGIRELHRR